MRALGMAATVLAMTPAVAATATLAVPVLARAAPARVTYSLSAIGIGNGDFTVAYQDANQLRQETGHTFAGFYWERTASLGGPPPLLRVNSVGPTDGFRMSCHITVNDGLPRTNGLLFYPGTGDSEPQDC